MAGKESEICELMDSNLKAKMSWGCFMKSPDVLVITVESSGARKSCGIKQGKENMGRSKVTGMPVYEGSCEQRYQ